MYEKRIIDESLGNYFEDLPAILIESAKAVGKTETCSHVAKTVFSLDNEGTRLLLKGDPEIILREAHPVLLDEWQLLPYSIEERPVSTEYIRISQLLSGSNRKKISGKIDRKIIHYLDESLCRFDWYNNQFPNHHRCSNGQ